MRILHISTRLILGGSQENTLLSCEGQARLGHEVHLAFGPIYGPEGSLLARVEAFNARCTQGTERVRIGRVFGFFETDGDMALGGEIVNLIRLDLLDDAHKRR